MGRGARVVQGNSLQNCKTVGLNPILSTISKSILSLIKSQTSSDDIHNNSETVSIGDEND
jgi:hypothetical protein